MGQPHQIDAVVLPDAQVAEAVEHRLEQGEKQKNKGSYSPWNEK